MKGNIFSLAFQGVRRKKKSSILIFLVLLLSFAFAITSLSLVDSMSKTNTEWRLNTYGEWLFGIPSGMEQDAQWLEEQDWADKVGVSRSFGTVSRNSGITGFGSVDDTFKKVGRLRLDDGAWPTKINEIAMEADILKELGYDCRLGQEINVMIDVPSEGDFWVCLECSFVLCGIIHEYTDLWSLEQNNEFQKLNGVVVTEEAAKLLIKDGQAKLKDGSKIASSVPQYFITVSEENKVPASAALQKYMRETRADGFGDFFPCQNYAAYRAGEKTENTARNNFYVYAIAAVTLMAVLCVYIMQLPAETHSFAVLRSIGITKGQMAGLLLTEAMILCLPAILLGIPLGMGLTWLALTLAMYSGSVAVQVVVPFSLVIPVLFLWVGMVLLSRLIVFWVTARTPLTGRMQMQQGKSRRARIVRSGFIVFLMSVFCGVTIFTVLEADTPKNITKIWSEYPPYILHDGSKESSVIPKSKADLIKQVSGVREVVGFGERKITISFDGTEIRSYTDPDGFDEKPIYLCALDETQWEETFQFGEDREAFHNGDLVFMLFDEDTAEKYVHPQGSIQIHGYVGAGKGSTPIPVDQPILFTSEPTPVAFRSLSKDAPRHTLVSLYQPYTVICSEAYLQKLLDSMEPGAKWGPYVAGEEFGYERIHVFGDKNAGDLSTDLVLMDFCKRNQITISNRREEYTTMAQGYSQTVILLYSSGSCIALMALFLCLSSLSMETEQEKRYFGTMRVIGMSSNQMTMKIMGKALFRSGISVLAGWLFYNGYYVVKRVLAGKDFWESLTIIKCKLSYFLILSLVCLLVPFILSLFAKRNLKKESRLS